MLVAEREIRNRASAISHGFAAISHRPSAISSALRTLISPMKNREGFKKLTEG